MRGSVHVVLDDPTEPALLDARHVADQAEQRDVRRRHRPGAELLGRQPLALELEGRRDRPRGSRPASRSSPRVGARLRPRVLVLGEPHAVVSGVRHGASLSRFRGSTANASRGHGGRMTSQRHRAQAARVSEAAAARAGVGDGRGRGDGRAARGVGALRAGVGPQRRGRPAQLRGAARPRARRWRGDGRQVRGRHASSARLPSSLSPDAGTYSLIAAAAPGGSDRGIGFALKLRQRAWALARGARPR